MNFFFDFDGVLADTAPMKRAWLESNWGALSESLSLDRSTIEEVLGADVYASMQADVGFEDTLVAAAMPDAIDVLNELSKFSNIVVVSARPAEKIIWVTKWLAMQGVSLLVDDVISSHGSSKANMIKSYGCGVLVDNDVRHAQDLPPSFDFLLFSPGKVGFQSMQTVRDWKGVRAFALGARDLD